MSPIIVIANKNYSSWSLRPWILMRHFGVDFDEIVVPLGQPTTREQILRYSPSGKVPVLHDGDIMIWDSLAIIEYLAERSPGVAIWPEGRAPRAQARALAAEMHSGFVNLRAQLPMNMRRPPRKTNLSPEAGQDVARIEQAFAKARGSFARGGAFLFGAFSAADAMFAPIVNRLHVYDVAVSPPTRAYMDAMMGLPAWRDWAFGAEAEPWTIEKYELP